MLVLCEVPEGRAARLETPRGKFSFNGCGMLDVDRVEMILPQVHLRNGECLRNYNFTFAYKVQRNDGVTPPPSSPAAHFRARLPLGGLCSRRGRTEYETGAVTRPSRPLQSLDVRHLTGASLRIAHCRYP